MDINELLKKLQKDFAESVSKGSQYARAEFISTGVQAFDSITYGGLARGHMTELHGLENSGKTNLSLQAIAAVQANGGICAYIDAEGRFNRDRAESMGVKMDKLLIMEPQWGEQAGMFMRNIIEDGTVDLIVLDSLPALTPRDTVEADEGDGGIGRHAKMWAIILPKLIPGLRQKKTALLVLNQMRENLAINKYAPGAQDPYKYPGGKAQKYYASNRVEIKKLEKAKESGYAVRFKNVKSSFGRPFMEMDTFYNWETGFSKDFDILTAALSKGVITKDGGKYFFGGEQVAFGEPKLRRMLEEDANFASKIKEAL